MQQQKKKMYYFFGCLKSQLFLCVGVITSSKIMLGTLSKAVRKDTDFHSLPGAKLGKEGVSEEKLVTHLPREGGSS